MFMGIMALMNIIVITILSPKAIVIIKDYFRQRKEGKILLSLQKLLKLKMLNVGINCKLNK